MKNTNIMKNAWQMRRDTAAVRDTNIMNIPWSDVYHVTRQHYLDSIHKQAIIKKIIRSSLIATTIFNIFIYSIIIQIVIDNLF